MKLMAKLTGSNSDVSSVMLNAPNEYISSLTFWPTKFLPPILTTAPKMSNSRMFFCASHQFTQVSRKMSQKFPDWGASISSFAVLNAVEIGSGNLEQNGFAG